jgi:hypothetical protein
MRAALRHQRATDGRAAHHTRLTGALVDAMFELKESATAFGVDVIGDGGAALFDGLGEHFDDGLVQFPDAFGAQARANGQGMNAGAEEGFIGIDIADAADEMLIEQDGLDAGFAALEARAKFSESHLQRFGA